MEWLTATKAAKRLEVARPTLARIARTNGVRLRQMPGESFVRYNSEDLDLVMRESIVVAGQTERATA